MKSVSGKLLACSVILSTGLVMGMAIFVFAIYPHKNTDGCVKYYEGRTKQVLWNRGEWHHYVDFQVAESVPSAQWRITRAPMPSSFWRVNPADDPMYKRVGYRWPSDWDSPFQANEWQICLLGVQ
jgi:hypothetical protein